MSGRAWTDEEVAVLRKYMPTYGIDWDGWRRVLPGRSRSSIQSNAYKHYVGIAHRRGAPAPWDDGQRIALVEAATAAVAATGHSLGECAMELQVIVDEFRAMKREAHA